MVHRHGPLHRWDAIAHVAQAQCADLIHHARGILVDLRGDPGVASWLMEVN